MPGERFAGASVLVTGAASGIGAASAELFAREGANVTLVDKAFSGVESCQGDGWRALQCDVSDPEAARGAVTFAVGWAGGLDVLVNSAGYPVSDVDQVPDDAEWRAHFEADVHAVHYLADAAQRHLEARGGAIVNVTSVAGLGGDRAMQAYDAAKGAAVRLTNALAIDLGPRGVRVNAVCPTLIHTAMSLTVEARPKVMRAFRERVPLGRMGRAEEVAEVIAFLASPAASYIAGVALPVDGVISAGNGQPGMG